MVNQLDRACVRIVVRISCSLEDVGVMALVLYITQVRVEIAVQDYVLLRLCQLHSLLLIGLRSNLNGASYCTRWILGSDLRQ